VKTKLSLLALALLLPALVSTGVRAEEEDLGLGLLIHFGLESFRDGEKGDTALTPVAFNPTALDAGQWARAARESGAGTLVLSAKGEDGFCLWPTATTTRSVRSSGFREGRGDLVREVAEAARREGLRVGIALAYPDRNEPSFPDPAAYETLFERQLEELLAGYGPLAEVRIEGAEAPGRKLDREKSAALVRKRQPQAVLVEVDRPEAGELLVGLHSSIEDLLVASYRSIGNGSRLLLATVPDARGLIPEADLARLRELGTELRRRFGKPLRATGGKGEVIELDLPSPETVDQVLLVEDLGGGAKVRRYVVEVKDGDSWRRVAGGSTIGRRRVHQFNPVKTREIRLRVLEASAPAAIRELSAFRVGEVAFAPLHLARAREEEAQGNYPAALADYDLALSLDRASGPALHARAGLLFKMSRFPESIADYDRAISAGGAHDEYSGWERGLALYYAGQFDAARKQFEGYHRFDAADIENGLWRYLSIAQAEGRARAVETLTPYPRRSRPPFPALHDLYGDKGSLEAVLAEAEREAASAEGRKENLFYAHYYIAKHLELLGKLVDARLHLKEALERKPRHFMADCARIDFQRLRGGSIEPPSSRFRTASLEEERRILGARDGFVASLSPFDRAVRVGTPGPVSEEEFLAFAAREALPWEEPERARLEGLLASLEKKARALKLVLLQEVLLIKTSGREEAQAAYTRANAIVLPRNKLGAGDGELEPLLAHELFHVLSRARPELRKPLYKLLGFEPTGKIELPEAISDLKITNPDAPTIEWSVEVESDGKPLLVTPVLFSSGSFDPRKGGDLFKYLTFRLMAIEDRNGRAAPRLSEGKPILLDPEKTPSYKKKVGLNSGYLIHPEEVLADNFVLLLFPRKPPPHPEILSEMQKVLSR
jgi:alpha-L-fucosidase